MYLYIKNIKSLKLTYGCVEVVSVIVIVKCFKKFHGAFDVPQSRRDVGRVLRTSIASRFHQEVST
jgi:hypothetical protein